MTSQPNGKIPTFTPTMLNTADRCLHQYRRKYIDRVRSDEGFSPVLVQGNAVHAVLSQVFEHYRIDRRERHTFPINLLERVHRALPRDQYPSEEAWTFDVERTLAQVKWVLMAFDGSCEVVAVERTFEYSFPGNRTAPAFRLRATVDLVLRHDDGTIEHLDFKTGNSLRVDPIQNTVCRIVVGQAFHDVPRILSSTAFLQSEATRSDELTREDVKTIWTKVKELATTILTEQEWLPTSNPLCPWCPLYQRGCALYPSEEGPDATTDWLEGAA